MERNITSVNMDFWINDKGRTLKADKIEALLNEITTLIKSKGYVMPEKMCSINPKLSIYA